MTAENSNRWLRSGTQVMLLLTFVGLAAIGWIVHEEWQRRQQRIAAEALEEAGCDVWFGAADSLTLLDRLRTPWRIVASQKDRGPVRRLAANGSRFTDADLMNLGLMTNLVELNLDRSKISDKTLQRLSGLTRLSELRLGGTDVTDAGLANLKSLGRLKSLNLDGTLIADAGLQNIEGLTELSDLNLSGTGVSDAGLVWLRNLTRLTTLDLSGTRVTDAGVVHLRGMHRLERLFLAETNVTETGWKELEIALPKCLVYWWNGSYRRRP